MPVFINSVGTTLIHVDNDTLSVAQWNQTPTNQWVEQQVTASFRAMRFVSITFQADNADTKDGKVNVFINGILQHTEYMQVADDGMDTTPNIESLVIGSPWYCEKPFKEILRSLSIYNRALSGLEVKALYDYVWSPPGPAQRSSDRPNSKQIVSGSNHC
ncbi:MAG: hypothetical protein EXS36_01845 [Pedosphaera sp.]|nr:hypothetical protein [Pedosphaera sp.]